jgi:hypothetical protein
MKVVDNSGIIPASINAPLSDQWSKNNDLWKSGVLLENFPVLEQISVADRIDVRGFILAETE